jgi:hypothetical protein
MAYHHVICSNLTGHRSELLDILGEQVLWRGIFMSVWY